jgi:hypothetical protein
MTSSESNSSFSLGFEDLFELQSLNKSWELISTQDYFIEEEKALDEIQCSKVCQKHFEINLKA